MTRLLPFLLILLAGCYQTHVKHPAALSVKQPPIPQAVTLTSEPVLRPCTNCPPPLRFVVDGQIKLSWTLSKSSNIVEQILYRSATITPFYWYSNATMSATQNSIEVQVTNPAIGFFAIRAINSNGYGSPFP